MLGLRYLFELVALKFMFKMIANTRYFTPEDEANIVSYMNMILEVYDKDAAKIKRMLPMKKGISFWYTSNLSLFFFENEKGELVTLRYSDVMDESEVKDIKDQYLEIIINYIRKGYNKCSSAKRNNYIICGKNIKINTLGEKTVSFSMEYNNHNILEQAKLIYYADTTKKQKLDDLSKEIKGFCSLMMLQ